jgi:hypothetical protein
MTDKKDPAQLTLDGMFRTDRTPPIAKTGRELRDEGMERARKHAGESWIGRALDIIRELAIRQPSLWYDDYQHVADVMKLPKPPDGRAWGPVLKIAATNGWITKTGESRKSNRPICHRADKPVYRSNLYRGKANQ